MSATLLLLMLITCCCYLCTVDSSFDDQSSTTGHSVDSVNSSDAMQPVDETICHVLACVFCGAAAAAASQRLKVLPCLHITCQLCLTQFLSDKTPCHRDGNFAASIFSCPQCSYTVQLPSDGVAGLQDAKFLQSAIMSQAAESSIGQLSDTGMPLSSHSSHWQSHVPDVKNTSLSLSLMEVNCPEQTEPLLQCQQSSTDTAETLQTAAINSNNRNYSDGSGDDRTNVLDKTLDVTRSQIRSLSRDAICRQHDCTQAINQTKLAARDLDVRKMTLHSSICERADYLCEMIRSRCSQLLSELDHEHAQSSAACSDRIDALHAHSKSLHDSRQFAGAMLTAAAADDVPDQLATDVAARLNQLLLCDTNGVGCHGDITMMRLDVPNMQHEEAHVEKLFGSLVKGTVGSVHRVTSFTTELQWPTGFVVTRGHGSVLAGKTGAFSDEGQVLFYDCHGTCVHRHTLPTGHLPVDVVSAASGDILVSDIGGRIAKFSSSGRLIVEWTDMFQGPSGHMAVNTSYEVLVTSAGECCIHRYHEMTGQRLATFALHWPDSGLHTAPDVTAIAVNSHDEIIVTASNLGTPYFFAADGQLLYTGSTQPDTVHTAENGRNVASVALPSAVCCDTFDNVLIADFLGNCIYLMSRSGLHLGRLLTKAHGVACPNLITLDQDGRLYVGQYGGDVLVFHYLSYVKHV